MLPELVQRELQALAVLVQLAQQVQLAQESQVPLESKALLALLGQPAYKALPVQVLPVQRAYKALQVLQVQLAPLEL